MPLDPVNDRRPPITPQLALRVAGVGVLAFVLFGIVFFRLWYLQVLDGDKYLAEARSNRVRVERIQAPRGEIVDASNLALVQNRKATVVELDPRTVPADMRTAILTWGQQMSRRQKVIDRKGHPGPPPPMPEASGPLRDLFHRLARVLQMSPKTINREVVFSIVRVPYANVRIRMDVPASERNYIAERRSLFPGVSVDEIYVRRYPYQGLAAQLLGNVGQITKDQLKEKRYKHLKQGSDIGQTGLEAEYDQYLRGTDGSYRIEVNAAGERRQAFTARDPKPGRTLKLTLHQELQQAGESAIRRIGGGLPGAFVAMNPETGSVYAMGSLPSYNPRDLSRPMSQAAYEAKFGKAAGSPLFNRADQSVYPTGSTFKPITALAAMSAGVMNPMATFNDTGCLQTGARKVDVACNAGHKANGSVNLVSALKVSSDVYFYNLGLKMYAKPGLPLQKWAHTMGFGRRTGLDIPFEEKGNIPGPDWVERLKREERACRKRTHKASCGIAFLDSIWGPGQMANLAVGQGGLQATPLQLAVAYSTIVANGRVPRPHLADEVQDANGRVERLDKPTARRVNINPAWRDAIMRGLHDAANADGGTSKQVFDQGWPRDRFPIFGKTGTAERVGQADQSWYVAYSYDGSPDNRPIVVVCTIERAGFGAEAAAPAARLILSKWFGVQPKVIRGTSTDR